MLLAAAFAVVLAAAVPVLSWHDRVKSARMLLWVGAMAPFLIPTPQKTADVASNVGAGELVRGALPAVCFVLSCLLAQGVARRQRPGWAEAGLAFYLALAVLSTLWSVDAKSTLLKALVLVATYACIWRVVLLHESPRQTIDAAAGVAYCITGAAAVEFFVFRSAAYAQIGYGPAAPNRLASVYPQIGSNVLAWVCGFAAAGLLLGVGPAAVRRGLLRWGLFAVAAGEAVLTGTRLAVAIWAVVLIAVSLATVNRRPGRTTLALAAGTLGSFYVFTHQAQVTTLLSRGQGTYALSTLTGRTVIWHAALDLWHAQPWAGFGYYSGHRFLLSEHNAAAAQVQDIDSTWIETMVDVGVVGLACLVLFAVVGLLRAVAASSLPERHRAFASASTLALVGVSFVNPSLQTTIATQVLGGAVLLALPKVTPARRASARGSRRSPRRQLQTVR